MNNPLVKTKLFIPQIHRDRVKRPRLVAYLNQGLQYPLVLVSSPAGSGKTTALAEWIGQLTIPAAWISLDEGDNDLSRFLMYLLSAVQAIAPNASKIKLDGLDSPEPFSTEYIVTSLVNDLSDRGAEFVLVLDDYHVIQAPSIHRVIAFLLEHQPRSMHLVIATRMDPRLPLSRMRFKDQVLEMRLEQLRFTAAETSEYLNQRMGLSLAEDDLHALLARTEGWIASLQMAALSLKNSPEAKSFIRAFSGSNRYVMDYLVDEVLALQPAPVQAFLLQTSILERLSGLLCDAVLNKGIEPEHQITAGEFTSISSLQGAPGQEMLEYLERSNLFIIPLDEERQWYRYHHLFASLLRAKLAHLGEDFSRELHLRAADWYEQNKLPEEAIYHALLAGDYLRAARLVEGIAATLWLKGEYSRLMEWIKALPDELARSSAWLCIWNAWSLTQTGLLEDACTWIAAAERAFQKQGFDLFTVSPLPPEFQAQRVEIVTLKALTAGLAQDYKRAAELATWVLENPPEGNDRSYLLARCQLLHGFSSLYFVAGELSNAEQACLETIRLSQEVGFILRYLHAVNKLAYVYKTTGQLHRSYLLLKETLALFQQQGVAHQSAIDILRCRMIDLLYEWNRLEEARLLAGENITVNDWPRLPYVCVDLYNLEARALLLQGDYAGAQNALDRAAALGQSAYIWPGLVWQTLSLQVKLWLQKGEVLLAGAWVGGQPAGSPDPIPFSNEAREIARARVLIAQGSQEDALLLLNRLALAAEEGGRKDSLIVIHTLTAAALQSRGHPAEAVAALEKALELAEPEGYVRTFLDEGGVIVELLSRLAGQQRSPCRRYAQWLVSAWAGDMGASRESSSGETFENQPSQGCSAAPATQADSLSRRELEVLRCMAEGLSNAETAGRLVIETSTVKRHINSIFSKLGVSNRIQAINKAREYEILPARKVE